MGTGYISENEAAKIIGVSHDTLGRHAEACGLTGISTGLQGTRVQKILYRAIDVKKHAEAIKEAAVAARKKNASAAVRKRMAEGYIPPFTNPAVREKAARVRHKTPAEQPVPAPPPTNGHAIAHVSPNAELIDRITSRLPYLRRMDLDAVLALVEPLVMARRDGE